MVNFRQILTRAQKSKTLLTGIIAFGFCLDFVGAGVPFEGVSPYARAKLNDQKMVFAQIEEESKRARLLYETGVKERIGKIINGYRTSLEFDDHKKFPEIILAEAGKYGFDPLFLTAVIVAESSFNKRAKSSVGALGLMQIRPATARALVEEVDMASEGSLSLYDPVQNISLGAFYLNKLIVRFGDLPLALEAYNHGPTRLTTYLKKGKRPDRYSKKVLAFYRQFRSQSI